ncbi:MAG TPA: hypothetical protein VGH11_01120 [Jatrophihabitans sp.]
MRLLALSIGPDGGASDLGSALVEYRDVEYRVAELSPPSIDAALDARDDRRLVIDAGLAGLNLVLYRLMRRGELHTAEIAMLPRDPVPFLRRMGLPPERKEQAALAIAGRPRRVGVIKDDSGGLCLDSAMVTRWAAQPANPPDPATFSGARPENVAQSGAWWVRPENVAQSGTWWARAVVDDQRLVDGDAREVSIRRLGPSELEATVRLGRFRTRSRRGRSVQLACDEALISTDGVERERPRSKRTFWSEPTLLNLVLPP